MDGRGDYRRFAEQPCFRQKSQLDIGITGSLANPGAVLTNGDAAADDQVNRLHPDDIDCRSDASRGLPAGSLLWRNRELARIEAVERPGIGQSGHGHVQQLPFGQGSQANRILRLVRHSLYDVSGQPRPEAGQPFSSLTGAGEVRNMTVHAWLDYACLFEG